MTLLFATLDTLLILAIFIAITALSAWMNKRKQEQEEQAEAQRRASRRTQTGGGERADEEESLEEALRRLLGGQNQESPPVLAQEMEEAQPETRPLPPPPSAWRMEVETREAPAAVQTRATVVTAPASPRVVPPPPRTPPGVRHDPRGSASSAQAVDWLRRPETARNAFVAAQVLGPPKALQTDGV